MRSKIACKSIAAFLLLVFTGEILTPVVASALTSGPASPEFTSFEPIGTTGMVNEFNGSFTYNLPLLEVPGPHGSGYPISIAYHSGATLEEDASWVGFGWSLNTGAINRSMRGFPDDYDGQNIKYINQGRKNETFVIGNSLGLQAFSKDLFTFDAANRYNTFTGYSVSSGIAIGLANCLTFNVRSQNGITKTSATVNWAGIFDQILQDVYASKMRDKVAKSDASFLSLAIAMFQVNKLKSESATVRSVATSINTFITQAFSTRTAPSVLSRVSGSTYDISFGFTGTFDPGPFLVGAHLGIKGMYSFQKPESSESKAYGYLYDGAATDNDLSDYGVEREPQYTTRDRYLYGVHNNYDIFSCMAQGVIGGLRLQHRRPGVHGPTNLTNTFGLFSLGLEVGVGPGKIGAGASLSIGYSTSDRGRRSSDVYSSHRHERINTWNNGRVTMRFSNDKAANVRFSANEEPTSFGMSAFSLGSPSGIYERFNNMSNADSLVRLRQSNSVSYRTNEEIVEYRGGVNSNGDSLRYYALTMKASPNERHLDRSEPAIKKGIGEIAIRNQQGGQYVFGLPVYSRNEHQLTYTGSDAQSNPVMSKFVYGKKQWNSGASVTGMVKQNPYASSFLLTEVRTADYIDRTLNGPTVDDYGGYTHFLYRRAAGTVQKAAYNESRKWYKWRLPYHGYHHEAGNLSLAYDDRASVSMGERETYYLSTIETKTHSAFFVTNMTDTTITLNGQPYRVKGSGKPRYDAFEAYNTGDLQRDESVCGESAGAWSVINTGLVRDSATRFLNMVFGGRKLDLLGKRITNEWIDASTNDRPNKSEYLERIILMKRTESGDGYEEIIKTVNFGYDYEIMSQKHARHWRSDQKWDNARKIDVPEPVVANWDTIYTLGTGLNSAVVLTQQGLHASRLNKIVGATRLGKLTLKRVWTDYGAVKSAAIAPYEFQYTYRNPTHQPFASEVSSNSHYASVKAHDEAFIDLYQPTTAKKDSTASAYQNPEYEHDLIDAWGSYRSDGTYASRRGRDQLKQSNVSGVADPHADGRVYDAAAWQLKVIKLPSGGRIHVQYEQNSYAYVQDRPVEALLPLSAVAGDIYDIDCSSLIGRNIADVKAAVQRKIQSGQKIYFKLLYPILKCATSLADPNIVPNKQMEYVTGYANGELVSGGASNVVRIRLKGSPQPKDILKEFLYNQSNDIDQCENHSLAPKPVTALNFKDRTHWQDLAAAGDIARNNARARREAVDAAATPYLSASFIKIPCLWKYGGGVRVKRIYLYDGGVQSGRAGLYGKEYVYERTHGSVTMTSGVATNEPATIRDESALTRFMVGRSEQSWLEQIGAGEDLSQLEGPLCPSLYPSASIGYSRVIVKNIVETSSSPGFTVTDYYTAEDYPVQEKHTYLKTDGLGMIPLTTGLGSVAVGSYLASQGMSVILNEMHGAVKSIRKCSGSYTQNEATWNVVESETHEYYEPGEAVPVLTMGESGPAIVSRQIGTHEDVCMETRNLSESSLRLTVGFDLGWVIPIPPFFHFAPPNANISDVSYGFGVVTKTISHSLFEKRVTVTRDGMRSSVENIAFDEATGNPLIIQQLDDQDGNIVSSSEVDGTVTSVTIPAWCYYTNLSSSALNEGVMQLCSTVTTTPWVISPAVDATVFVAGDFVHVWKDNVHAFGFVKTTGSTIELDGAYGTSSVPTGGDCTIEIVRSGRTNQVGVPAMNTIRHGGALTSGTINWSAFRVSKSTANTFSDTLFRSWSRDGHVFASGYNDYEKGLRGKWRLHESFVYRMPTGSTTNGEHPSLAGRTEETFNVFPVMNPSSRDTLEWVRTTTVERYDHNGEPVEEIDALKLPSSAIFAHKGSVPAMVVKNAEYGSTQFMSFEDSPTSTTVTAHTGKRSRQLTNSFVQVCSLAITPRVKANGLLIRAWSQSTTPNAIQLQIGTTSSMTPPTVKGKVAGWSLIEWSIPANNSIISTIGTLPVYFRHGGTGPNYIDDIRIQPELSQTTCYVYDAATLRLVAQFDDQHYAALYKYDDEGRLRRKERETTRGIFPLQEQHTNTPLVAWSSGSTGWPAFGAPPLESAPAYNLAPGMSLPGRKSGVNAKGDILRIDADTRRSRIKLFDKDVQEINIDSLRKTAQEDSSRTRK